MSSHEEKFTEYNLSTLVVLRWFVLWGIFECIVFIISKGDKTKELIIHSLVFALLTVVAYVNPNIMRTMQEK
jgi:hypothetical protein